MPGLKSDEKLYLLHYLLSRTAFSFRVALFPQLSAPILPQPLKNNSGLLKPNETLPCHRRLLSAWKTSPICILGEQLLITGVLCAVYYLQVPVVSWWEGMCEISCRQLLKSGCQRGEMGNGALKLLRLLLNLTVVCMAWWLEDHCIFHYLGSIWAL